MLTVSARLGYAVTVTPPTNEDSVLKRPIQSCGTLPGAPESEARCPHRCPEYSELSEYSEYSERENEGPTGERRAFKVSLSLGKLMLYQLSYSRFFYLAAG
jgi:hypothetical protein